MLVDGDVQVDRQNAQVSTGPAKVRIPTKSATDSDLGRRGRRNGPWNLFTLWKAAPTGAP